MTTETSEFPLVWDDLAHAERTWRFDLAHSPDVMTPLGFDLYYGPFITGMGFVQVCLQNYYAFLYVATARPGTADAQAAVAGARRWQEEILPEVLNYDEHYRFTDFEGMPTGELISEIDRASGCAPALRTAPHDGDELVLLRHDAPDRYLLRANPGRRAVSGAAGSGVRKQER